MFDLKESTENALGSSYCSQDFRNMMAHSSFWEVSNEQSKDLIAETRTVISAESQLWITNPRNKDEDVQQSENRQISDKSNNSVAKHFHCNQAFLHGWQNSNLESSTGNSQLIEDRSERDAENKTTEGRKYK